MAVSSAPAVSELRESIGRALKTLGVVGASVVVVQDGETVLCEGFGRRAADADGPADAETLFAIGSATKAFTTMSIALLAEDGKLDWDAPIRTYLPEFALHDAFASAEVTPRDMACHRVGLPRHEAVWYKSPLSRAEIVERVRYLEPSRPFRTTFQYQNMMFTTLGYLVERVSGQVWEAFAQERILDALGMTRTNFSVHRSQADPNHARPYGQKDGASHELPFADIDTSGPAGSINSCARDMAEWLRLHLGNGEVDGRRIVSEASLQMMHQPHIVLPPSERDERRRAPAYGLGWFTEVYQGIPVVHHGGNIDGFSALVFMVPEKNLGIAVLCNQEQSVLPAAVAYMAVDRLLGLPERDWPAYLKEEMDKMLGVARQAGDFSAERVAGTSPSHPLEAYAGLYEHPAYGTVKVENGPPGLHLHYHMWPGAVPLEHFHYDTFVVRAEIASIPMALRMPFRLGLDGTVESFEVQIEPSVEPATFRRKAVAPSLSQGELARYAGTYMLAGIQKVRVEVAGDDALAAFVEGQPALRLVAEGAGRFGAKGAAGLSVQFEVGPDGTCLGGRLSTPNGLFPLERVAEA
jgi:CubicO group peptidase (beta-lactamase class C family)